MSNVMSDLMSNLMSNPMSKGGRIEFQPEWARAPFGHSAPAPSTRWLRRVSASGLSRGIIARRIAERWRQTEFEIVDLTVRGVRYRLHFRKNTTDLKLLCSSKVYDSAELAALAAPLRRGTSSAGVFVDVGANTGYYALSLAQRGYGRVIAIEPNPTTLEMLRCNVSLNECGERIRVVPLCVGDGGQTPFYCSGGLGDASVIASAHNCDPIMVDSAPLLDIVTKAGVQRIDAMKIDIEGFEDRALGPFFAAAPTELHPTVIVIEICHRNRWQHDIVESLVALGYTIAQRGRTNWILSRG